MDVVRFEPIKIQEGVVRETELKTQGEIGEAMNSHSKFNNASFNP